MKMIKRELFLCLTLTAFVFVCALAWGSPFLSIGSDNGRAYAQQQTQSALYQGTVLRNGEQFFLRDASGQIYRLDDPQHVQSFEGKTVSITGRLDPKQKMIHVERIESATV